MAGGIDGKLDDRAIRNWVTKARAGKAPKQLSDGWGMYLTLTKNATPVWQIAYRFDRGEGLKEFTYSVGVYPLVTLKAARDERAKVKEWLRQGRDPVQARLAQRAAASSMSATTFEDIAGEWLKQRRKGWSAVHYEKSKRALERDVYPDLGRLAVQDIEPAMVSKTIEAIVRRGTRETAAKVRQHIEGVFRLAQSKGLRSDNPAEAAIEVLPKAKKKGRMPALLTFGELGAVMRSAEAARLSPAVRMAHRLAAFAPGARIGNIVMAQWSEFNLDTDVPTWIVPRQKMKAQDRHHDHKIVLPPVLVDELRAWRGVVGGQGYVFPSPTDSDQPITRESLEKAYRVTLGLAGKHSPHGWRSAFSTLARDNDYPRELVELTLDHVHDNDVARAYDRGERLQQRVKLMAWWGEQLAQAQRGAEVLMMKRAGG